jgi:hypothetical protein
VSVISTTVTLRDLDTTVDSTTDGLFGLTKYPAKFIPQLVNYPLDSWLANKTAGNSPLLQYLVTDPFAGVGTVAISAHLRGLKSQLWDINPLTSHYNHAHAVVLSSQSPVSHAASALTDRLRDLRLYDLDSEYPVLPLDPKSLQYLGNWYHPLIFSLVSHLWYVYYNTPDEQKALLLAPLLRVTNKWSYNDLQRQKLCRSDRKTRYVNSWLRNPNWRQEFVKEVIGYVNDAANRYADHKLRAPWHYDTSITILSTDRNATLPVGHGDIVITSPPYLQAQEYIRASKLSLLWLGHSLDEVRARSKMEIPYCDPLPTQEIASPMFNHVRRYYDRDNNKRAVAILDSYFTNTVNALERASQSATDIYLTVGSANLYGTSVPLHIIFSEHFVYKLGWSHRFTLHDRIVAKTLFKTPVNPATNRIDNRMATEQIVWLSR